MTDHEPENIVVAYPKQENIEIPHRLVETFCTYCRLVKPVGDFADRANFDAFKLRPWLGFIMILDYLSAEEDFRYRIYGTRVADHSGFDMTGRQVSDFEGAARTFFTDLYRDRVTQKRLIYSEHQRVHGRFDCDSHDRRLRPEFPRSYGSLNEAYHSGTATSGSLDEPHTDFRCRPVYRLAFHAFRGRQREIELVRKQRGVRRFQPRAGSGNFENGTLHLAGSAPEQDLGIG